MEKKPKARNWRDVKAEAHRRGLTSAANVEKNKERLLDGVRAYRLAEIRRQQGRTQQEVADELAVAQSRISAIENGDIMRSELGTVSAYVEALGGHLRVVAEFGDQTITVE